MSTFCVEKPHSKLTENAGELGDLPESGQAPADGLLRLAALLTRVEHDGEAAADTARAAAADQHRQHVHHLVTAH